MSVVLITGSSGLVGSESVNFFCDKGFDVVGIDNNLRQFFFGKDGSTNWVKNSLLKRNKNFKSFFLVNTTIQNIKVYIPGVKNPTINSNTRLFLNLKINQSIFLRLGDKMIELIKINDSIQNNSQINLADLIDNAINK